MAKSRKKRKAHAATKRKAIKKALIAFVKGGSSNDAFNTMKKAGVSSEEFREATHRPVREYEINPVTAFRESKTSKRKRKK